MANLKALQKADGGILNVIFHGTFVFQRNKEAKQITAWVPRLDHHVYRAGNWLAETELKHGRYMLRGVETSGEGEFDPARNVILEPPPTVPTLEDVHAQLIFPWPKKITSLRLATIPLVDFDPPDEVEGNLDPQHLASVQIFAYDFRDDTLLKLTNGKLLPTRGHYWEPAFVQDNNPYINLHIFSAEDHYEQPSLAYEDFNTCVELFDYDLELKHAAPVCGVQGIQPPEGVDLEETEDLAPRTLRMALVGRMVKQDDNATHAWYGDDALNGNPHACGGPVN